MRRVRRGFGSPAAGSLQLAAGRGPQPEGSGWRNLCRRVPLGLAGRLHLVKTPGKEAGILSRSSSREARIRVFLFFQWSILIGEPSRKKETVKWALLGD